MEGMVHFFRATCSGYYLSLGSLKSHRYAVIRYSCWDGENEEFVLEERGRCQQVSGKNGSKPRNKIWREEGE